MIASCPIHKPCNAMFDFDASSLMGVWRSVSANVQCSAGIAVFLLFHYISIIYSPILSLKCCSVVPIVLRELQSGCSPICDIVTGSSINDIRSILYSLSLSLSVLLFFLCLLLITSPLFYMILEYFLELIPKNLNLCQFVGSNIKTP